jgi:predicted HTH domain antitoxin
MVTAKELVQAGLFPDEQTAVREALRVLWQERPQLRMEWAIYQYQTEAISLAKAAALAGVSFDRMRTLLIARGVQPRLGAETLEEAREDARVVEAAVACDAASADDTASKR